MRGRSTATFTFPSPSNGDDGCSLADDGFSRSQRGGPIGRSTGSLDRFDLIVGADILYDRTQWQHLEPFWRHHLAPGGRVLLGEPGRPTGGMFLDWLKGKGWAVAEFEQPVPTRDRPIRVFELRGEDGGK